MPALLSGSDGWLGLGNLRATKRHTNHATRNTTANSKTALQMARPP